MPGPPVARIRSASLITSLVSSSEGTSIHPMIPSGAPALTAAYSTTLAAAMVQFLARGCGEMMIELRVFKAISVLKIAVEEMCLRDRLLMDWVLAFYHSPAVRIACIIINGIPII